MVALVRWAALGVACLLVALGASAQTPPLGSLGSLGASLPGGLRGAPADAVALEGAVDPRQYVVGPGDVFSVVIGGLVPREFTATVSADGRLVIPEAGAVQADGRTLAAVRADVIAGLRRRVRNVVAEVALAQPRQFYVHVSGAVPEPGRRLVRPVARVEDSIVQATGLSSRDLARYSRSTPREGDRWPALRNVTVERDGAVFGADLMRYFATGDLDANPYLRDGDAVHLPTFDPVREGAFVGGAVDRPGTYDVRPDDTAYDLVMVATGRAPESSIARVRVARLGGAVEEVSLDEARRVRVGARDQIFAVSEAPDAGVATVVGAVRYPGTYPIVSGETTLEALVQAAGGLEPDALARGTYLERRTETVRPERREAVPVSPSDALTPAVSRPRTLQDEAVRLDSTVDALGGLGELDLVSRRFVAREFLRTARVSIDAEQALRGETPVVLRDGDRLVVPEDRGAVRVFGGVARPGFVDYTPGLDADAYVERAGGATPQATERYVVEAGTGRFVEGGGTAVRPGDAVFVNREPSADDPQLASIAVQERQVEATQEFNRAQGRFQVIQSSAAVIGALGSLIFAYVTLTRD